MAKIIFVTGGVISGIGKGITTASIGVLFKQMGLKVMIKKLDPYLNVDPGTMSPEQHGEVFVTEDGTESDMDLGHYERYTDVLTGKANSITSGKIYQTLINNERKGVYLGKTVQTIPHVTDLIKDFINIHSRDTDVLICEIGGTVGDIEALPFFETARQIKQERVNEVVFVHLTYVPFIGSLSELKTKPTQHSVKELMSIGIVPDFLICRSTVAIGEQDRRKISLFCNVRPEAVINAVDVNNIYEIPIVFQNQKLDEMLSEKLSLKSKQADLKTLKGKLQEISALKSEINIMIAGKYDGEDSYKSLIEAIKHAAWSLKLIPKIKWVNTRKFDKNDIPHDLFNDVSALIVPGGFGSEGTEGKIKILSSAREKDIPTLGICLGLQLMTIEFARNTGGMPDAHSEEFSQKLSPPMVGLLTRFESQQGPQVRNEHTDLGGTMRLGAYESELTPGSLAALTYGKQLISERHRHRYEINASLLSKLESKGMQISGVIKGGELPEIVEVKGKRFFLGVQFHPELKSTLAHPHPLFVGLIRAAKSANGR